MKRAHKDVVVERFNKLDFHDDALLSLNIQPPPKFCEWLKRASESADITMSVCIGARHLAKLGLPDGKMATTHHDFIKPYSEEFPKVHWVSGQRFVEGPKIATSAGVTAGIDLALRVFERYFGRKKALEAAWVNEYQGTA